VRLPTSCKVRHNAEHSLHHHQLAAMMGTSPVSIPLSPVATSTSAVRPFNSIALSDSRISVTFFGQL
jgi:hypothetical protein